MSNLSIVPSTAIKSTFFFFFSFFLERLANYPLSIVDFVERFDSCDVHF